MTLPAYIDDSLILGHISGDNAADGGWTDQDQFATSQNNLVERHVQILDQPQRIWQMTWQGTAADYKLLRDFRLLVRFHSWYCFNPWVEDWTGTDLVCGTGDGSSRTFTIPGKTVSGQTVKVAGVSNSYYTISSGTGAMGEDQIVFTVGNAPANAAAVTIAAILRRQYRMRFTDNRFNNPQELASQGGDQYYSIPFNLKQMFTDI